jgi:type VI secretion system protein
MREERLLERIRAWEKEPQRRGREDARRTTASILNHLQRILNTRRGNAPIADDYGVPDFTDLLYGFPDSVREMEKSIRLTIQKYEPRLQAVRVSFIPQQEDRLSLRFQVAAKLAGDQDKVPVYFETVVDSAGKVKIRG